jgi:hypothetical protein
MWVGNVKYAYVCTLVRMYMLCLFIMYVCTRMYVCVRIVDLCRYVPMLYGNMYVRISRTMCLQYPCVVSV